MKTDVSNETHAVSRKSDGIKTLQRGLSVFEKVAQYPDGISITEIAELECISKSNVFKILTAFAALDYVRQDEQTKLYKLGFKILKLSRHMLDNMDLRTAAKPILRDLRETTTETVTLALYRPKTLTYIDVVPGNHGLRMMGQIGGQASLTCSAVGKATLAFLDEQSREEILREIKLDPQTRCSHKNLDTLREDLEIIRKRGFSVSREEMYDGVVGVGAPIFSESGKCIATIAVSGPKIRINDARIREYGQLVCDASMKISREMGYDEAKE